MKADARIDWEQVRRHEVGKDRRRCNHFELADHLLKVLQAGRHLSPESKKQLAERVGRVARQRPQDCDVCNPMAQGKGFCADEVKAPGADA